MYYEGRNLQLRKMPHGMSHDVSCLPSYVVCCNELQPNQLFISVDLDKWKPQFTAGAWIYGIEMKFSALIELGTIGTHYWK